MNGSSQTFRIGTGAGFSSDRLEPAVDLLKRGAIDEVIASFTEYSKKTVAEMGGRALATMLGVASAMSRDGKPVLAQQYGDYAQSSGSNNAVLLIGDKEMLTTVEKQAAKESKRAMPHVTDEDLASLEETE